MCGIAGYSCWDKYDSRINIALPILALHMEARGRKSWGWTDGKDEIVKELGEISAAFNPSFFGYREAALHTRQPTTGGLTKENSHPFRVGNVLGMHNGIVRNHEELQKKYNRTCAVDSEHIFYHINEGRDLNEICAYGAIVFWKEGKLYLGRFNGGELSIARTKNAWLFASTKGALEVATQMAGLKDGIAWFKLKEDQLYRIEGDRLFKDEPLNFKSYSVSQYGGWEESSYGYSGRYTGYRSQARDIDWKKPGKWVTMNVNGTDYRQWISDPPAAQASATTLHQNIHGLSRDSQKKPIALPASTSEAGDEVDQELLDRQILLMIADAADKVNKHEHSQANWPCCMCAIKLFEGDFYYMSDSGELFCEACAKEFPENVVGYRLHSLPDDIGMVEAFFKKSGDESNAEAKIECDECAEMMEGTDYFVAKNNQFICVQCFSEGDGKDKTEPTDPQAVVITSSSADDNSSTVEYDFQETDAAYIEKQEEKMAELIEMTAGEPAICSGEPPIEEDSRWFMSESAVKTEEKTTEQSAWESDDIPFPMNRDILM